MRNVSKYQSRFFLTLADETEENQLSLHMLKSPLGLSHLILQHLFTNELDQLQRDLDKIKGFAAGVTRSRNKSEGYTIASYYPSLFAFHQFVHSSFRARQGKVLEKILDNILEYSGCDVPNTTKKKREMVSNFYGKDLGKHDIDSLGLHKDLNKLLIIQIRSRDDTGGTTAKGSLVELLSVMLKEKIDFKQDITYLVMIWVPLDGNQKKSTIRKFYNSLSNVVQDSIDEDEFFEDITQKGYRFKNTNITIKLDYGLREFANTLQRWAERSEDFLNLINVATEKIENWDDLWISYAIASLEIEIKKLHGINNIDLLKNKLPSLDNKLDTTSYDNLVKSIDRMTEELIKIWSEDSLPVKSLSDSVLYLRDLLFLYACYKRISREEIE